MRIEEALALIKEAHKSHYKPSKSERDMIDRIQATGKVSSSDRTRVIGYYRRAVGGGDRIFPVRPNRYAEE